MDINENQLNFELYKTKGFVDVFYYRAATGDTASNATIRERLDLVTEGFPESDVSKEQFLKEYEFGKYPLVRDWIRHFAEQGKRLQAFKLFEYITQ